MIPADPEVWIEQSRARRSEIAEQIRDLRYESDDLLAQELAIRIELARLAMTNKEAGGQG